MVMVIRNLPPGSRPFLKDQLHLNAWPPHDGQRVFDEGFDGKHAWSFSKMTIANEIQAAGSIPKPVGIDLPPGHTPACGRIVAYLDPFLFGFRSEATVVRKELLINSQVTSVKEGVVFSISRVQNIPALSVRT